MDYSIWPASHATGSTTGGANEKAPPAARSSPRLAATAVRQLKIAVERHEVETKVDHGRGR
jgi:hypothetical protein